MKSNVIIIGGSKNLGKFLCDKFINKYNVINISRSKNSSKRVSNFLCDLSNEEECVATLKKVKKKFKKISTVIICSGDSKKTDINKLNFQKKMNSNFFVVFNFLENFPKIFKRVHSDIIVFSSIVAKKNINGAPLDYTICKVALNKYLELKSKILIKNKIRINVISPGNILIKGNNWSEKLKNNPKKIKSLIKKSVPINDFVKPEEILLLIELILSKKINSMVGSNLVIDGGQIL